MEILSFVKENMVILVPALYSLGYVIKHTRYIKDKNIPLLLTVIGIIMAIGLGGFSMENIVQGVLVAGATVLGNELIKQSKRSV